MKLEKILVSLQQKTLTIMAITNKKNYCAVHHLYYNGAKCPLCEKERIERMAERYVPKQEKTVKESESNDREINEEDLVRLANKFNVK